MIKLVILDKEFEETSFVIHLQSVLDCSGKIRYLDLIHHRVQLSIPLGNTVDQS